MCVHTISSELYFVGKAANAAKFWGIQNLDKFYSFYGTRGDSDILQLLQHLWHFAEFQTKYSSLDNTLYVMRFDKQKATKKPGENEMTLLCTGINNLTYICLAIKMQH